MTKEEMRNRKKEERLKRMISMYMIIAGIELLVIILLIIGIVHYSKDDNDNVAKDSLTTNTDAAEITSDTLGLTTDVSGFDSDMSISSNNVINLQEVSKLQSVNILVDSQPVYATLTILGDVMMHQWQIQRSYDEATDSFDVSESFTYIKDYLAEGDYSITNLETTLNGRNNGVSTEVLGYCGYPMFNSPEIIVQNLKDAGIDMLQTANNHSMDNYEDGVYATIDQIDAVGLDHTGTFKSQEEADDLCIVEINGITFGFVAYTYCVNGINIDPNQAYCINTLDYYTDEKLEEMYSKIRQLDEAGVDFVCPLIHWGTEYSEMDDSWQDMIADEMFAAGADVIFGGHPHVVEPMDVKTITNPDGTTRTGYVIYSFGNFISSQKYDGANKDIGFIGNFQFSKQVIDGETVCSVSDIKVTPTYVYWTDDVIGVVPVIEAYNNQANYPFLSSYDWQRIEFAKDYVGNLLTTYGNLSYTVDGNKLDITPNAEFQ